ncbi:thioesterase family protein [Barnesiella sp. WM24]|uniref:acyl-CoA thioesterase n=1 Tax=Barnesiella sp. WM24 TaxID=2558278 RepID=UPI001FD86BDC|nr:thioesterase family protein [Barnesiella sp. WM24]
MATNSSNSRVPVPEFPFRHEVPLQIRFNDIDMLGHLNNSVYIQFFDLGKSSYFQAVLPDGVDWKRINIVVANINCDFFAPTYITEPIAVRTTVTRMGEKSFSLEQRIVNTATEEVKCIGKTIMVGFDLTTGKSAPIEQKWIDALEAYEQRKL